MRKFDERYTIVGVSVQMRREAFRGIFLGRDTQASRKYLQDCKSHHIPSQTTVVFSREQGPYDHLGFRTFERCLTIIIEFADLKERTVLLYDPARSHAWVEALFGSDHLDKCWMKCATERDRQRSFHLWCDEKWRPIWVPNEPQEEALRKGGFIPYEYPKKISCIASGDAVQSNYS